MRPDTADAVGQEIVRDGHREAAGHRTERT